MKKRVLAVLLAATMALILNACGGGAPEAEPAPAPEAAPLTVGDAMLTFSQTGETALRLGMRWEDVLAAWEIGRKDVEESTVEEYQHFLVRSNQPSAEEMAYLDKAAEAALSEDEKADILKKWEIITGFECIDPAVVTSRGIGIGSTVDEVKAAYGEPGAFQLDKSGIKQTLIYRGTTPEGLQIEFTTDENNALIIKIAVSAAPDAVAPDPRTIPEDVPMPEAEPESADDEEYSADGVLDKKLEVSYELHAIPGNFEEQEIVITIKNNTNNDLKNATLLVKIDSESEGRLFRDVYHVKDLAAWKATSAVGTIKDVYDAEFTYRWSEDYQFAENEATEAAENGAENQEKAKAFYDDVMAADYLDWSKYLVSVKCLENGDREKVTLTFKKGVDDIAAGKPLGFESIANVAGWNGYGGVFPTRIVLQYEDGSVIIDKVME